MYALTLPHPPNDVIVAIDGPASSGKSTTAHAVAEEIDLLYLDTGAMYRAVALAFLRAEADPTPDVARPVLDGLHVGVAHDEKGSMRVLLDGEDVTGRIRRAEVTRMASEVSALPTVREKMIAEQRRVAAEHEADGGGVVLDGRDIGTVVFPEADVKIFLIADAEVRARRRHAEMSERGEAPPLEEVLANIRRRDAQDRARTASPLKKADDAIELDTSELSIDEQVAFVTRQVREQAAAT